MTSTEITWGDPIDAANDGKPLPWLNADEVVYCIWSEDTHSGPHPVRCVSGWTEGFQIKLPADHPYYKAVALGFAYWPGGESAPDDWDGGVVLMRNGRALNCSFDDQPYWQCLSKVSDIIGYCKRAEPADDGSDYVRVKRMTRSEIDKAIKDCDYDIEMLLDQLGVSKEDSVVEKFERDHGGLDNNQRDIIEAFIAWQNNHG